MCVCVGVSRANGDKIDGRSAPIYIAGYELGQEFNVFARVLSPCKIVVQQLGRRSGTLQLAMGSPLQMPQAPPVGRGPAAHTTWHTFSARRRESRDSSLALSVATR